MIEKRDMKIFGKVILYSLLVIIVAIGGYFYYWNNIFYLNYDNIDDIVYAEPSERAKNFDIEGYINSLPELEYKKVEYPVKETYEYRFNGYKMTIDIPEGFKVYEIPLTKKPKIRNTKNLSDSCMNAPRACADGDKIVFFSGEIDVSDKKLCIVDENKINDKSNCEGISVRPIKSHYKGISMRDIYIIPKNIKNPYHIYKKFSMKNGKILMVNNEMNELEYGDALISDSLELSFNGGKFSENLFLNILNSIKIEKI